MTASTRRRSAAVALLVVAAIVAVWLAWPRAGAPGVAAPPPAQTVVPGTTLHTSFCHHQSKAAFAPTRITIPHVTTNARVFGLPRDPYNVPSALPLSSPYAKTGFSWDDVTARPGSARGNVLLNTHTWPDDSSMGNHLLDHLQVGHRVILHGAQGQEYCYRVTKRVVIVASDGSKEYYDQAGPPQVAIIVCSPPRLGPGNWYHRTIWYASPVGSPQARDLRAG